MVNYKVRAFYEKDNGSVGADVVIYSDTGDVIDTILITTQCQYNQLVSRLEGIDETYIDMILGFGKFMDPFLQNHK